ncbi:MAG: ATP-binding protein [Bacteroidales bacterium]|nr:ATP-binding protein [Bacteroidales bacterium]
MKDLKPTRSLHRLQRLIDEGEHEQQDFKYLISDARKIARSISAFANHSGGRLLIGVKDNGTIAGVRSEEDIYMIEQASDLYCSPHVTVDFEAIKASGGAVVFIATVERALSRPVSVREAEGKLTAYYRVKDENLAAPPLMVEAWRLAADSDGLLLKLDDIETQLIDLIHSNPGIDMQQLAVAAHASARNTRRALVHLLALDVIRYHHDGRQFTLIVTEP